MSAIFGMFGEVACTLEVLRDFAAMAAALEGRAGGIVASEIDRTRRVALGSRFFATRAGEAAAGICFNEDRSMAMVCDGHVFNAAEIRSWLVDRGHRITGTHSSELLLHLYEEEGAAGWRRADGQFALAIYDGRRGSLVLGRDFLGVRPVYFWSSASGIVFASEIKGLLPHSRVPRDVDEVAVSQFLTFTSVPGARTLFRDIRKLPPGTAAVCEADGRVELARYWDLLQNAVPEVGDERYYVNRVRELHARSVRRRMNVGAMGSLLSGGNDSSANASLLARYGARPLHTFTVGLADVEGHDKYNDVAYARRVAADINSEHHERLLTTGEFLATIPATIDAMDDLVSEPSSVFLYHALQLAKEQGLKVVVTGEANDELCCGHGGMVHIQRGYYDRWLPYMRKPAFVRSLMAAIVPAFRPKLRDILRRAAAGQEYFWSYETAWMESDKPAVLARDAATGADSAARIVEATRGRFDASDHRDRDYLFYVIYSMMQDFYFGNLMLGKLDLLASSAGVEPRCPYTEPEYARFVFNVPANMKTRDGLVKFFFKKAIEGVLANEIIYRPKQGFRTPVVELYQGALGRWAEPVLLDGGLTRTGLLRREHLRDTLERHRRGEADYANRLWTAMTLNLWHERWITGPAAVAAPVREAV